MFVIFKLWGHVFIFYVICPRKLLFIYSHSIVLTVSQMAHRILYCIFVVLFVLIQEYEKTLIFIRIFLLIAGDGTWISEHIPETGEAQG